MDFLKDLAVKLRPNVRAKREAERFCARLQRAVPQSVEVMLGGSLAKGTNIKGAHDADVFVRFPLAFKDKDISALAQQALASFAEGIERVHGSRDYFHVKQGTRVMEVVPVLKVRSMAEAMNVTDMSPLHVAYVRSRIKGREDEVRLAKQFCKALKVYGAESYIRGFSGHVLELLVLYYGSFLRLVEQAAVWGDRVVIDPEKKLIDPLKSLNRAKTLSPLVIVDPVQDDRNSAAALSKECFAAFRSGCRAFLKKPSSSFFAVKPLTRAAFLKGVPGVVYEIVLTPLAGSKDVSGTKLKLAHDKIIEEVTKYVRITESAWEFDGKKSLAFIAVPKESLPRAIEREGPPLREKKACAAFTTKHPDAYVRGNRWYAKIPLAWKSVEELSRSVVSSEYVRSRSARALVRKVR